mmetsp:Transcript_16687/g.40680  ORF Transcript_16687/g.40680 Transcript_16687/m.40680 type:complete len:221 (-) Transcript_16687:167-829(-)
MGNCIARSPKVQQSNSNSNAKGGVTSKAAAVLPEKDASLSATAAARSSDLLRIAEPSDGSFALLYPNLEFSCQKLPNNNAMDPIPTVNEAAQKAAPGQASPPLSVSSCEDGGVPEPSDRSLFACFYPDLEFSRQTLPNNNHNNNDTMDPPIGTAASSGKTSPPPTVRECNKDGSTIVQAETLRQPSNVDSEKSSASNALSSGAESTSSSSRPVRVYAREA